MKLVNFKFEDKQNLGVLRGDQLVAVERFLPDCPNLISLCDKKAGSNSLPLVDLKSLLELGAPALDELEKVSEATFAQHSSIALNQVKFLAPITNPSKIIAIGQNYLDHCREQKVEPPTQPLIFAKFPSSLIGHGDTISWSTAVTAKVDFEAELAVVIGKRAKNVSEWDALDIVAGYTIANDVTARDLQFGDKQWVRGKSLDTFCPLGPCFISKSEIPRPNELGISSALNGEIMQQSSTAEMIFNIPFLVAYISKHFTVFPGDIILTGTPHGVGVFRDPRVFMKDGDLISVSISGLGTLDNSCHCYQ